MANFPIAPLPFPPKEYDARYFTETIRTLNSYFRQLQDQLRVPQYTINGTESKFFRSAPEIVLADDEAGYIEFAGAATRGILAIGGDTSAAMSALISFRVGDVSAFVQVLSSAGGTVTGTTGTLAGTTGTDTQLTISADTATNRLYVENRTGAAREYVYTILSITGPISPVMDVSVFVVV